LTEDTNQITGAFANPAPAIAEPGLTAGALIRRAREASGLHIAALAVALKVPVKKLEALEADRFELLLDAVFVRALAASVCRLLKVDSTEILRLLPSQAKPQPTYRVEPRRVIERSTISPSRPNFFNTISRSAIVGGWVLVLGTLALVFLPPLDFLSPKTQVVEGDLVVMPTLPVMAVDPSPPDQLVGAPSSDNGPAMVNSAVVDSGSVMSIPEGVQTGTPPSTGIVVFQSTAESWVEVTDARGSVLLRRKLVAGEVAGASGLLPLNAVVGRANVIQVKIRGQLFDLAAVTRDNIARFEVK